MTDSEFNVRQVYKTAWTVADLLALAADLTSGDYDPAGAVEFAVPEPGSPSRATIRVVEAV